MVHYNKQFNLKVPVCMCVCIKPLVSVTTIDIMGAYDRQEDPAQHSAA